MYIDVIIFCTYFDVLYTCITSYKNKELRTGTLENHVYRCSLSQNADIKKQLEIYQHNKLCFNCLKPGHQVINCGIRRNNTKYC